MFYFKIFFNYFFFNFLNTNGVTFSVNWSCFFWVAFLSLDAVIRTIFSIGMINLKFSFWGSSDSGVGILPIRLPDLSNIVTLALSIVAAVLEFGYRWPGIFVRVFKLSLRYHWVEWRNGAGKRVCDFLFSHRQYERKSKCVSHDLEFRMFPTALGIPLLF